MNHSLYFSLLVLVTVLFIGTVLCRYLARIARTWALKRRFRRGAAGEDKAARYLLRHGYTILKRQATKQMSMTVDGHTREFEIRADFLVRKHRKNAVVEVKTGKYATDPVHTETRRQLLEYAVSYNADTVYLFDADENEMRKITLYGARIPKRSPGSIYTAGVLNGMAMAIVLLWLLQEIM